MPRLDESGGAASGYASRMGAAEVGQLVYRIEEALDRDNDADAQRWVRIADSDDARAALNECGVRMDARLHREPDLSPEWIAHRTEQLKRLQGFFAGLDPDSGASVA